METELKLLIRPEDAEKLRQHPLLKQYATDAPRQQTLSGIYYDTRDHDLRQADAGLRVRQVNQDWIQTLKAGGSAVAGLYQRNEWESKVSGPTPDLNALRRQIDPKSHLAKLIKDLHKRSELFPAFTTSVQRTVWDLRLPTGDEVECVIDLGSIDTKDGTAPVSEFELELKSGDPRQLFELALRLQNDVPMQIGGLSKADRGYGLAKPVAFTAAKARPIRLSADMSIEGAFKTIVLNCLEQIQSNQAGVTTHHDTDSLHQMRVGLRRLRSALAIFEQSIPCPESIQVELQWLGGALGIARDWDVFYQATLPGLRGMASATDILQPVLDAVADKVRTSHEAVAASAGSSRYTRLVLTLFSWIEGAQWRSDMQPKIRRRLGRLIADFAGDILKRDQQRLLKRGRHLQGGDVGARHRLRIAAKRARYAAEFFTSLYPGKRVRPYVRSLALLQEDLGGLNDTAVAKKLLRNLEASHPQLRVEAAFIWGYIACRLEQDHPGLLRHWKRFKAIAPPHVKGR